MEVCEFYVDDVTNRPMSNILYSKTLDGRVTLKNPTKKLIDYMAIGNVYFDNDDIFGLGDAETKEDLSNLRDGSCDNLANKETDASALATALNGEDANNEGNTGGASPTPTVQAGQQPVQQPQPQQATQVAAPPVQQPVQQVQQVQQPVNQQAKPVMAAPQPQVANVSQQMAASQQQVQRPPVQNGVVTQNASVANPQPQVMAMKPPVQPVQQQQMMSAAKPPVQQVQQQAVSAFPTVNVPGNRAPIQAQQIVRQPVSGDVL